MASGSAGFAGYFDESLLGFGEELQLQQPECFQTMVGARSVTDVNDTYIAAVVGTEKCQAALDRLRTLGLSCKENSIVNYYEGAKEITISQGVDGKMFFVEDKDGGSPMRADFNIAQDSNELYEKLKRMMSDSHVSRLEQLTCGVEKDEKSYRYRTSTLGGIKDSIKAIGNVIGQLACGEKIHGAEIANLGTQFLSGLTDQSSKDFSHHKAQFLPLCKPKPDDPKVPLMIGATYFSAKVNISEYKDKKTEAKDYFQSVSTKSIFFQSPEPLLHLWDELAIGGSRSGN